MIWGHYRICRLLWGVPSSAQVLFVQNSIIIEEMENYFVNKELPTRQN